MFLKPHSQMTQEELRGTVTALAQWAAERWYRLRHPGASDAAARRFAGRTWRQFIDVAIDILGLWEALGEAEAAAGK